MNISHINPLIFILSNDNIRNAFFNSLNQNDRSLILRKLSCCSKALKSITQTYINNIHLTNKYRTFSFETTPNSSFNSSLGNYSSNSNGNSSNAEKNMVSITTNISSIGEEEFWKISDIPEDFFSGRIYLYFQEGKISHYSKEEKKFKKAIKQITGKKALFENEKQIAKKKISGEIVNFYTHLIDPDKKFILLSNSKTFTRQSEQEEKILPTIAQNASKIFVFFDESYSEIHKNKKYENKRDSKSSIDLNENEFKQIYEFPQQKFLQPQKDHKYQLHYAYKFLKKNFILAERACLFYGDIAEPYKKDKKRISSEENTGLRKLFNRKNSNASFKDKNTKSATAVFSLNEGEFKCFTDYTKTLAYNEKNIVISTEKGIQIIDQNSKAEKLILPAGENIKHSHKNDLLILNTDKMILGINLKTTEVLFSKKILYSASFSMTDYPYKIESNIFSFLNKEIQLDSNRIISNVSILNDAHFMVETYLMDRYKKVAVNGINYRITDKNYRTEKGFSYLKINEVEYTQDNSEKKPFFLINKEKCYLEEVTDYNEPFTLICDIKGNIITEQPYPIYPLYLKYPDKHITKFCILNETPSYTLVFNIEKKESFKYRTGSFIIGDRLFMLSKDSENLFLELINLNNKQPMAIHKFKGTQFGNFTKTNVIPTDIITFFTETNTIENPVSASFTPLFNRRYYVMNLSSGVIGGICPRKIAKLYQVCSSFKTTFSTDEIQIFKNSLEHVQQDVLFAPSNKPGTGHLTIYSSVGKRSKSGYALYTMVQIYDLENF